MDDTGPTTALVWGLECEACKAMYVTPAKPWPGGKCKSCDGDLVMVGAGRATYAEDGTVAHIEHVSMTSREVAEAMMGDMVPTKPKVRVTGIDHKKRTITFSVDGAPTEKPTPKRKKASGKSPTRKVVPVQRSGR